MENQDQIPSPVMIKATREGTDVVQIDHVAVVQGAEAVIVHQELRIDDIMKEIPEKEVIQETEAGKNHHHEIQWT
jgi:hypothetical protein